MDNLNNNLRHDDRLWCGEASTSVSTGIMQVSDDESAKNTVVCVIYLRFLL